ncbi:hypothetical protein D3C80_516100 [compost metagenome]
MDDFQRPVHLRQPKTVTPAGEHHAAKLRHDGDNGVEHRQVNRAADHPRQRRPTQLADHVADRIGLFGHFRQGRRANQQSGEGQQLDQYHDRQRQHDGGGHGFALLAHVLRHIHRGTVAVIGKQRDADHGDDQRYGNRCQHAFGV